MDIFKMNISELADCTFDCPCGKRHSISIDSIAIGKNVMDEAVKYVHAKTRGHIMIICDENTYGIAGREMHDSIIMGGGNAGVYMIPSRNGLSIAPNDSYIGEVFIRMPKDTGFFIAVGSGVVNDITRQVSCKMGKEYMVFGTAPSMDGYASVTSSLIINNIKESIEGQNPCAIYADTDILKKAPFEMLTAGFGDVIGKYNAIREWDFSHKLNGEHYCSTIVELVKQAVLKCEGNAAGIKNRHEDAVTRVMEALILSGMAMGLYGNTRPASGAEHHIVHYWDVDCIKRGLEHPLHGNSVGVGTLIICRLYDLVRDKLPVAVMDLDRGHIERVMLEAGCQVSPASLGISRELLKESIINGHTMSSKFTVLTYLSKEHPGLLEEAADKICREYY
jgi:glycerol-1-phosphate dehydrogenase [NAD(P)+]